MNDLSSPTEKSPQPGPLDRRKLLIILIVGGAVLLFIAIAILVVLGLRGARQPTPPTPTATPTVSIEPTSTAFVSPLPEPSCETIISSGDVEMSVALPVSVTAKNATYPVNPIVPQEDAWTFPPDRSGEAVWVCGTIVNYVVGLEPTAENEALLDNLAPGDEMKLQLTSGAVLRFRFAERRDASPGAEFALAQQEPRLTLVLPRSDAWQIATGDYVAEAESVETPPPEASAQPGETLQVDGARVTMTKGYVRQSDDLPPETAYYMTDVSVENVGEAPLATDSLSMRLRDSLGNTYLLSPQASEAGDLAPLSGDIQPGASAQGSVGFLVPYPLPAGPLTWVFSLRAGAEDVRVRIPQEGGADEGSGDSPPEVAITDAFLADDGDTLIIEGELRNVGGGPLVVEPADLNLTSAAGMGELILADPSLPWEVRLGETLLFDLEYRRPDASTVLLQLLGYSFEVGGLQ
jgi:hypothetical protein